MHYHIKIEEEKKMLERQYDFNTVACFTCVDARAYGYVDFDSLKEFLTKFDKTCDQKTVNAILRRMNSDEDFKIDFTEFSLNITPVLQGYTPDGCITPETDLKLPTDPESDDVLIDSKFLALLKHDGIAFNLEVKKQVLRDIEVLKKTQIRGGKNDKANHNVLRNFKQIYEQEAHNKVKNEFRDLRLKRKVKQDDQYMVSLLDVTPVKNQFVDPNYENSIIVNRIACGDARDQKENLDRDFGHMWQAALWGGEVPQRNMEQAYRPYETGRSSNTAKSVRSGNGCRGHSK